MWSLLDSVGESIPSSFVKGSVCVLNEAHMYRTSEVATTSVKLYLDFHSLNGLICLY